MDATLLCPCCSLWQKDFQWRPVQGTEVSKRFLPTAGPVTWALRESFLLCWMVQHCFEPWTSWPWCPQSTPDLRRCSPGPLTACGPQWKLRIRGSSNGAAVVPWIILSKIPFLLIYISKMCQLQTIQIIGNVRALFTQVSWYLALFTWSYVLKLSCSKSKST